MYHINEYAYIHVLYAYKLVYYTHVYSWNHLARSGRPLCSERIHCSERFLKKIMRGMYVSWKEMIVHSQKGVFSKNKLTSRAPCAHIFGIVFQKILFSGVVHIVMSFFRYCQHSHLLHIHTHIYICENTNKYICMCIYTYIYMYVYLYI